MRRDHASLALARVALALFAVQCSAPATVARPNAHPPTYPAETPPSADEHAADVWARRAEIATARQAVLDDLPALPGVDAQSPLPIPPTSTTTLDNGLVIITVEDHTVPIVRTALVIDVDAPYEIANEPAFDSWTALISRAVNETYTVRFADDQIRVSANTLADELDPTLRQLAGSVITPPVRPNAVARDHDKRLARQRARLNRPSALVVRLARRLLVGTGHAAPANDASPTSSPLPDALAFHETYCRPNTSALVVAGDVDPVTVERLARRYFDPWQQAPVPDRIGTPATRGSTEPRVHIIDLPTSAHATVTFAAKAPNPGDRGWFATQLLATWLSGDSPSTSLNSVLRDQRELTFGATVTHTSRRRGGALIVQATTRTADAGKLLDELLALSRAGAEQGLTQSTFARTKQVASGRFVLAAEGLEAMIDRAIELRTYALPDAYWTDYPAHLQAVTAAQFSRFATHVLAPDAIHIIAAGERRSLAVQLAKHGALVFYDQSLTIVP